MKKQDNSDDSFYSMLLTWTKMFLVLVVINLIVFACYEEEEVHLFCLISSLQYFLMSILIDINENAKDEVDEEIKALDKIKEKSKND